MKCVCAKSLQSCPTLWSYGLYPPSLLCPWDSPGKKTGVGCHALLQGTFPTQGSNPCLHRLLHCRQTLYRWATREAHDPSTRKKTDRGPEKGRSLHVGGIDGRLCGWNITGRGGQTMDGPAGENLDPYSVMKNYRKVIIRNMKWHDLGWANSVAAVERLECKEQK